jgi:hypothetical protein
VAGTPARACKTDHAVTGTLPTSDGAASMVAMTYDAGGHPAGFSGPFTGPPLRRYPPPRGIVPLRPLGLAEMFNGAITFIRVNPRTTMGLTVAVVVAFQLVTLALSLWPLALPGRFVSSLQAQGDTPNVLLLQADAASTTSTVAAAVVSVLSTILLSGLLTVVVGRAVFGAGITASEAWHRLRPRLAALVGFTLLEGLGALLLVGAVVVAVVVVAVVINGWAALAVGLPAVLVLLCALAYLATMLAFVPAALVLERRTVVDAVRRSFQLVARDFWRVLGIRLLAVLVAQVVAGAVAVPLTLAGQFLLSTGGTSTAAVVALLLVTVGGTLGQIVTAPFSAGVVVLQYLDRRMRAEAFDLVLRTGAALPPGAPASATDELWVTR